MENLFVEKGIPILKRLVKTFFIVSLLIFHNSTLSGFLYDPHPIHILPNANDHYSLINSVDFHPQNNVFCVTYTINNKIVIYKIEGDKPKAMLKLENPLSQLSDPQHASFSRDGSILVVANWTNQTFNVYDCSKNGYCRSLVPQTVIPFPERLSNCRPHGIAFSPCGNYLAVAFGASDQYEKAIALFRVSIKNKKTNLELISSLISRNVLPGIPKGIAFSPDGSCLLVTYCDIDALAIYDIDRKGYIDPTPRQMIQGNFYRLHRPEDVKMTSDGNFCAVSNSEDNTVTFYSYDKKKNVIVNDTCCDILENPVSKLSFPHGLAFSADGSYFVITQFGPIQTTADHNVLWSQETPANIATVNIYRLLIKE